MKAEHRALCQEVLAGVLSLKDGRRLLYPPFSHLPPRSFTDYYRVISEPIDLQTVEDKLNITTSTKGGLVGYKDPKEFFRDGMLVFLNAKYFNEPTSQIHKDAHLLLEHFTTLYNSQVSLHKLPQATPIKSAEPVFLTGGPGDDSGRNQGSPQGKGGGGKRMEGVVMAVEDEKEGSPLAEGTGGGMGTGVDSKSKRKGGGAGRPVGRPRKDGKERGETVERERENEGQGEAGPSGNTEKKRKRAKGEQEDEDEEKQGREKRVAVGPSTTPPPHQPQQGSKIPLTPGGGPTKSRNRNKADEDDDPDSSTLFPPTISPSSLPADYPLPTQSPNDLILQAEHEAIRSAMDETLVKWQGPEEFIQGEQVIGGVRGSGWWGDERGGRDKDWAGRAFRVMAMLREYVGVDGIRPYLSLLEVNQSTRMDYLSYDHSISLDLIELRLRTGKSKKFSSMAEFDKDVMKLFEKGRRWFPTATKQYGDVITLQRLYQSLTSAHERESLQELPNPSPVHFTSPVVPTGPGHCRPLGDSGKPNYAENMFTSFRVGTRDREVTSEARYKGMTFKIGDFVHVVNPDDASRPILGQVFRTWVPTGKHQVNRNHHITLCWYFRPEHTYHTPETAFYENETFKTGHFVDHPVEDILERVGCQFFSKYTRTRPEAPEWYPGWPLYVCNSRYKEDKRNYAKIKNWSACIPEELRKTDFMKGIEMEKVPHVLKLLPSPFMVNRDLAGRGITGGLLAPDGQLPENVQAAGDDRAEVKENAVEATQTGKNERDQKKDAVDAPSMVRPDPPTRASDQDMPSLHTTWPGMGQERYPATPPAAPQVGPSQVFPTVPRPQQAPQQSTQPQVASNAPIPSLPTYAQVPLATAGLGRVSPFPAGPVYAQQATNTNQSGSMTPNTRPVAPLPQRTLSGLPPLAPLPPASRAPPPPPEERLGGSTFAAWIKGGEDALRREWDVQELPRSTVELLETNSKGDKVLWFSGPPIDVPPIERPKHSAAYLTHLARSRHQAGAAEAAAGDVGENMDIAEQEELSETESRERLWGMDTTLQQILGV